jgi:amino acid transporter
MPTLILGLTVVGVSVLLAHLGLRLVRRKVPLAVLESHHEVAGFIIGVLGALYAVLLAFVVVALWNQYGDARASVEREANELGDLAHMAEGFPGAARQRLFTTMLAYAQSATDDEWPAMAHGADSPRTQSALDDLWRAYLAVEPATNRENALYQTSLDHLSQMSASRRLRIYASRDDLPTVIQVLLWGGGLITIAFTYFFGVKSIRSQALMTAALAGIVAFLLFLVIVLDNPFHGYVRVPPDPLQQVRERIHSLMAQST